MTTAMTAKTAYITKSQENAESLAGGIGIIDFIGAFRSGESQRRTKVEKAILLSLHPEWWEPIKKRQKTLEARRTRPKNVELPVRVIVYLTAPASAIVGEFLCSDIIKTERVERLERNSCVPLEQLERYADGGSLYGWTIWDATEWPFRLPLSSVGLEKPPQSWCYINVEETWP